MPFFRLPSTTPALSNLIPGRLPPRTLFQHPQKARLTTSPRIPSRPHVLPRSRNNFPRRHASSQPPSQPPSPNVTPNLGSPAPSLTLSQRMRKLSREYGWAAFGVYMGLSALDFPFCFLAVRIIGTERIGHWEHVIVSAVSRVLHLDFGGAGKTVEDGVAVDGAVATKQEGGDVKIPRPTPAEPAGKPGEWSWGVEEAQKEAKKDGATIWTQLALAYAIHKSFIFVRVPLTAAVTPKVVKTLRSWGWDIGKRKPKSS